jgi:hypothetical protein
MTDHNKHYAAATVAFLPESLKKRLILAILRADMRLLAVLGYSIQIPSCKVPQSVTDNLIKNNDYRLIRGTSDRILGTAHAKFNIYARYFSETYNDILFCNFGREAPRGTADVGKILDSQDWSGIRTVMYSKIIKDQEHIEFISSFRKEKIRSGEMLK